MARRRKRRVRQNKKRGGAGARKRRPRRQRGRGKVADFFKNVGSKIKDKFNSVRRSKAARHLVNDLVTQAVDTGLERSGTPKIFRRIIRPHALKAARRAVAPSRRTR